MKLKYRFKSAVQFFAFAFYPKTTLIVCTVVSVIAIAILGLIMSVTEEGSIPYSIVFALITGAVASFFVAIIVELSSNYRHNKLAWYELQDYYRCITDHENKMQVLMQPSPFQKAAEKARDDFVAKEGYKVLEERDAIDEDERPKDIIEATWEQLPKIIPILSDTYKTKKEFLSDKEIEELESILIHYDQIKREINLLPLMSPMIHNVMNHPDESYLEGIYPKNIISAMPEWVKKHLASTESQNAMDRLADVILSDRYLCSQLLEDYNISQNTIDSYRFPTDEQNENLIDNNKYDTEEDVIDYDYPETEDEFKAINEAINKQSEESQRPFVSWYISRCCADIADSIDKLEKFIIKKPYYSIFLKHYKKRDSDSDNPITEATYENEMKDLYQLLDQQNKRK